MLFLSWCLTLLSLDALIPKLICLTIDKGYNFVQKDAKFSA